MQSLKEYIEEIYNKIARHEDMFFINDEVISFASKNSFEKLIKSEDLCVEFIKKILNFEKRDIVNFPNKERASHCIITWLLGVGLAKTLKLNHIDIINFDYDVIWLLTAITHDYGYFCDEIKKDPAPNLYEIEGEYSLLTDNYKNSDYECLNNMSKNGFKNYFSYTYDEIRNYYDYAVDYHSKEKKDDESLVETCDHGIVGGCIAFREYCKKNERENKALAKEIYEKAKIDIKENSEYNNEQKEDMLKSLKNEYEMGKLSHGSIIKHEIQKLACFTAASHNIFKSSKGEYDDMYITHNLKKLLSSSPKRVKKKNTLLSLLSLVDTIDCSKRFSRRNNKDNFLRMNTILDNVSIKTTSSYILIDYSALGKIISKKNESIIKEFNKHIHGVESLSNWSCFNSSNPYTDNDCVFKVSIGKQ